MPIVEGPALLQAQLEQAGLWSGWATEVRFHPKRRWRFDLANPSQRLAVEIHGSVWAGGRHTRGKGFTEDRIKVNTATLMGWRVLEFTTEHITQATYALDTIRQAMRETN